MSRLRGSHLRSLRFVFSTVPFCQGLDGSQNQVCVPISACRWGQLTNSVPRSKVIDLRAGRGRSRMASIIFPMTGFARLSGFFRITVNRLTRATICGHHLGGRAVIAITLWHAFVREMIALKFSKDRRPTALQYTRHLINRDLRMPPAFYSASLCDTQLSVNGSHSDPSRQITCCFLTRVVFQSSARHATRKTPINMIM